MKVLHLIARLNVGGTARYIETLADGLQANGIEAVVATGQVQGAEAEDPCVERLDLVRVPHLGRKIAPANDYKARSEIKELIERTRPDLIHTHTFKAGALTRSLKLSVPNVHTFHGHLLTDPEFQGLKQKAVITVERRLAPRTKSLITVGKKVSEELLEVGIGEPEQYLSIPPGVEPLDLKPRDAARKELGIESESRPIVVWMARVTGVKRPDRLVEIARATPNARFLAAGGGDQLEWLTINAPENLTVLGWREATTVWAVADIGLTTSDNEGMPVALIEAQLAGIPFVGTDVGSVSEVIIDSQTGFVTPTNTADLNEALAELIDDQNLQNTFSVQAKKHANESFSTKGNIQAHINLYHQLLNALE